LVPMPPIPFTFLAGGQSGYFTAGSYVQITNVCGGPAWLQVLAWDARLGASYDDVVALGVGGYGQSTLFQLHGSDICMPNPPPVPPLVGLQSFSLVPEPSPVLLLLLGLPGLLLFCRRRRRVFCATESRTINSSPP
jgi:hypothetical protein